MKELYIFKNEDKTRRKRHQKSYKFIVSDLKTKRRGAFLRKIGYYSLGEKKQRVCGFNREYFIEFLRKELS